MLPRFKAAAVHAAPVFLDKQATTKKAISLIREAAAASAEIVVFPKPSFRLFRCGPPSIGF
jgi:aliphatic nitrilase